MNWLFDRYSATDSALELDPKKYIEDIKEVERQILALKLILESAVFAGKEFENFPLLEQKVKVRLVILFSSSVDTRYYIDVLKHDALYYGWYFCVFIML